MYKFICQEATTVFIDRIALSKQGDNALGSVRPSVRLDVCMHSLPSAAKKRADGGQIILHYTTIYHQFVQLRVRVGTPLARR